MKLITSFLFPAFLLSCSLGAGAALSFEFPGKILSAQWLKDNMDKIPNLRIVDVRKAEEYARGHIPGAVNIPYDELRAEIMGVNGMRRPPESWETMMGRRLGADRNYAIVAYTGSLPQEAGRLVWESNYYGHGKSAMLNGGFAGWVKAGGKTTTEIPKITPKYYVIEYINHHLLATNHDIMRNLKNPEYKVVDVRPSDDLRWAIFTRGITREGRIPGAINIPISSFTEDGYIMSSQEIEKLFASKGVAKHDIIVLTCWTGTQSSAAHVVLANMGYTVKNHDSSWLGWEKDCDTFSLR